MKSLNRRINDQRGISIMEMMIVVVMIGLLASLAVPSFVEQMPRLETKSQVRELVGKLREARSLAVARKGPAGVCFDGSANTWTVFLDNNPQNAVHNTGDSVIATGSLGSRVVMTSNSFSNHDVIFNPDGSCLESGIVWLAAEDASIGYTIDVLASTGRVKLLEGYLYDSRSILTQ
jgi:Tfp pilus assembly protein FimT